jgi:hypothetical protein
VQFRIDENGEPHFPPLWCWADRVGATWLFLVIGVLLLFGDSTAHRSPADDTHLAITMLAPWVVLRVLRFLFTGRVFAATPVPPAERTRWIGGRRLEVLPPERQATGSGPGWSSSGRPGSWERRDR